MGRTACTEPQCLYKGEIYLFFFLLASWAHTAECTQAIGQSIFNFGFKGVGVNFQLHATAALPPGGKDLPLTFGSDAG